MSNVIRFPKKTNIPVDEAWSKITASAVESLQDALIYVQCASQLHGNDLKMLENMLSNVLNNEIKSKFHMADGEMV